MSKAGLFLAGPEATHDKGSALSALLAPGDVVTLSGALAAGKTSFARGVLAGLGLAAEAASPSFPIVIAYAPPEVRLPVAHVDLYRIERAGEFEELGLDDALLDGALLIEWPERLPGGGWPGALALHFAEEGGGRRLTWEAGAAWQQRWPPARSR